MLRYIERRPSCARCTAEAAASRGCALLSAIIDAWAACRIGERKSRNTSKISSPGQQIYGHGPIDRPKAVIYGGPSIFYHVYFFVVPFASAGEAVPVMAVLKCAVASVASAPGAACRVRRRHGGMPARRAHAAPSSCPPSLISVMSIFRRRRVGGHLCAAA